MTDETPQPESAAPARHGGAGVVVIWIVVVLLILEFVLPGFLIGICARVLGVSKPPYPRPSPRVDAAINIIFYPAIRLAKVSPVVLQFYNWEVNLVAR